MAQHKKIVELRVIENVNQSLQCIEFLNIYKNPNEMGANVKELKFIIHLANYTSKSKYEFSIDKSFQDCCETISATVQDHNDYWFFENIEKLENIVSNFIGEDVEKITINETSQWEDHSIEFILNFTNGEKLTLSLNNQHNGYYPHAVWLHLTENDDANSMLILSTSI